MSELARIGALDRLGVAQCDRVASWVVQGAVRALAVLGPNASQRPRRSAAIAPTKRRAERRAVLPLVASWRAELEVLAIAIGNARRQHDPGNARLLAAERRAVVALHALDRVAGEGATRGPASAPGTEGWWVAWLAP